MNGPIQFKALLTILHTIFSPNKRKGYRVNKFGGEMNKLELYDIEQTCMSVGIVSFDSNAIAAWTPLD